MDPFRRCRCLVERQEADRSPADFRWECDDLPLHVSECGPEVQVGIAFEPAIPCFRVPCEPEDVRYRLEEDESGLVFTDRTDVHDIEVHVARISDRSARYLCKVGMRVNGATYSVCCVGGNDLGNEVFASLHADEHYQFMIPGIPKMGLFAKDGIEDLELLGTDRSTKEFFGKALDVGYLFDVAPKIIARYLVRQYRLREELSVFEFRLLLECFRVRQKLSKTSDGF